MASIDMTPLPSALFSTRKLPKEAQDFLDAAKEFIEHQGPEPSLTPFPRIAKKLTPASFFQLCNASGDMLDHAYANTKTAKSIFSQHYVKELAQIVRDYNKARHLDWSYLSDQFLQMLEDTETVSYTTHPDPEWNTLIDRTFPWIKTLDAYEHRTLLDETASSTLRIHLLATLPPQDLYNYARHLTANTLPHLTRFPLAPDAADTIYEMLLLYLATVHRDPDIRIEHLEETLKNLEDQGRPFPPALASLAKTHIAMQFAPWVLARSKSLTSYPNILEALFSHGPTTKTLIALIETVPSAQWPRVLLQTFPWFDNDPEGILDAIAKTVPLHAPALSSAEKAQLLAVAPHAVKAKLLPLVTTPRRA